MKKCQLFITVTLFTLSTLAMALDKNEQLAQINSQLGDSPSLDTYQKILRANPILAPEILAHLLTINSVNPQDVIRITMEASPNDALKIAQISRKAGISNEVITTAALLAGIDPTQISEATAAGIENSSSILTPPSVPAVGGEGGGGSGVISPN